MNIIKITIVSALLLGVFATTATAQRKKPAVKRTSTIPAATASADVKDGAEKVSIQIKNVTKFLYSLGGIAIRIEDLEREAKTKQVAQSALAANADNKAKVMQAIRNLRAGIATLEVEFRTKEGLKRFLPQIQGISDLTAECEDLAAAGQFSGAGRPLLELVERLSDTLAAMPSAG